MVLLSNVLVNFIMQTVKQLPSIKCGREKSTFNLMKEIFPLREFVKLTMFQVWKNNGTIFTYMMVNLIRICSDGVFNNTFNCRYYVREIKQTTYFFKLFYLVLMSHIDMIKITFIV